MLGPAEVAAWGILGTIWEAFEFITEAIGDAAEVRCSYLLGAGEPGRAKMSAYKGLLLGFFLSSFITSLVFIAGQSLPVWITNDPALQHIIADLVPLFGLGNMSLTIGQMCWTILGSQGRYKLATVNAFIGTCFVTLPLAALFSIGLNINLEGQTAAVVIGYTISGAINSYFIFTSDWEDLSKTLIEKNQQVEMDPKGGVAEAPQQNPPEVEEVELSRTATESITNSLALDSRESSIVIRYLGDTPDLKQ